MNELKHNNCARCDESIETQHFKEAYQSLIKLTDEEISLVSAKFDGSLCIPCLNQLKNSYKIIKGEFNLKSNTKVIS